MQSGRLAGMQAGWQAGRQSKMGARHHDPTPRIPSLANFIIFTSRSLLLVCRGGWGGQHSFEVGILNGTYIFLMFVVFNFRRRSQANQLMPLSNNSNNFSRLSDKDLDLTSVFPSLIHRSCSVTPRWFPKFGRF